MKTNFARFRYVLAAVLCCLVSVGVWGQATYELITDVNQLVSGASYLIVNTANKKAMSVANTNNRGATDITVSNNQIKTFIATDAAGKLPFEVVLGGSTGAWTFYDQVNNAYLNATPTTTSNYLQNKELLDKYAYFSIIFSSNNAVITCTGKTSRNILRYNTSALFSCYSSGQLDIQLFKKVESALPTPDFTYNNKNLTVNLGQTFTSPILTYNNSDNLTGLNISYISSNENVATINKVTGEVQTLSEGTTTITAFVAATDTYLAAQTSYELTIIDPNKLSFILDLGDENWGFPTKDYNTEVSSATYNNMTCYFLNAKQVTTGIKYFIFKTNGYLTLPSFENKTITAIKINTTTSLANSVNVSLYANDQIISENVAIGISTEQQTFTFNIPLQYQGANIAYKFVATTGNAQFTTVELIYSKISIFNGTMTLSGNWESSDLSSLDLTDPTITGIDMTGITIPTDAPALTPANPNCLIYVANAATYPDSWKNIVEATDALDIILQDGSNFYNTKVFDAAEITYTRTFAKGWNTFSLPFDATVTAGDVVEEFDTKTETSIKFKTATSIKANQAYLINIAADNTEKVFTGTGVVPVTASTGDTFKSNFTKLTGADAAGKYIMVIQDGKEVFAPASEKATVAAFRGYLDLANGSAPAPKYTIEHDGGATNVDNMNAESGMKIYSENGALVIYTNEIQNVQIYGLDGRMVQNIQLSEGNNTINGLAKGIYLINNQKTVVK